MLDLIFLELSMCCTLYMLDPPQTEHVLYSVHAWSSTNWACAVLCTCLILHKLSMCCTLYMLDPPQTEHVLYFVHAITMRAITWWQSLAQQSLLQIRHVCCRSVMSVIIIFQLSKSCAVSPADVQFGNGNSWSAFTHSITNDHHYYYNNNSTRCDENKINIYTPIYIYIYCYRATELGQ